MSNTPHNLSEEFPGQLDKIHALKVSNPSFAQLLIDYDEVNDEIHVAETPLGDKGPDRRSTLELAQWVKGSCAALSAFGYAPAGNGSSHARCMMR